MASNFKTPRRRWSDAFKKRVAAEAFQPGTSTAQIAGRYDLTANLVLNWKKKCGPGAALVPVEVTMDDDRLGMSAPRSFGCVEIDLTHRCPQRYLITAQSKNTKADVRTNHRCLDFEDTLVEAISSDVSRPS
jgi:Transposase